MALADRLVECGPLRKSVELVYATILPKASKPFIYMSITLPSEHVDVNVHPTKREVNGIDVYSSSQWGLFLNLSIFVLYMKTTWNESSRPPIDFPPFYCVNYTCRWASWTRIAWLTPYSRQWRPSYWNPTILGHSQRRYPYYLVREVLTMYDEGSLGVHRLMNLSLQNIDLYM